MLRASGILFFFFWGGVLNLGFVGWRLELQFTEGLVSVAHTHRFRERGGRGERPSTVERERERENREAAKD